MRRGLLLLAALAALTVPPAALGATITVGAAASGSQRTLHRGDTLVVRLPTRPSTGYAWRLTAAARPVLALACRTTVASPRPVVGAPATLVLRFRVAATGRATLRLAYVRSWEASRPPAKTFTLRVVALP